MTRPAIALPEEEGEEGGFCGYGLGITLGAWRSKSWHGGEKILRWR